ncbi:hypothetical protein AAFN85_18035 [Mucilaginibacter sp. CAU 1740]|uniref:hypothetical protein n=1 Tax=Mucilaginibacter sp. CAU 1740 TaxID=3140365 RepID=UPI00325BCD20
MRYIKFFALLLVTVFTYACNSNSDKEGQVVLFKGLYSAGPEIKSFKDCDSGQEFWAVDSSKHLELEYSQLNFEKPYEPVYVEVEGIKSKSGKAGMGSEYDSTIVVKKVVKITKEIPQDVCN